MRQWPDLSAHLPKGFCIRGAPDFSALGLEAPAGVNILTVAAIIAGEQPTEKPETVCPRTIAPCMRFISDLQDEARPQLLPFAWAMVGTNSVVHAPLRMKILGWMAIELARLKAPAFEKVSPGDPRVEQAMAAARGYWEAPNPDTAEAANLAFRAADAAAADVAGKSRLANHAAHGAACAARCAHSAFIAFEADDDFLAGAAGGLPDVPGVLDGVRIRFAADAAEHAAMAAITPHDVAGAFWREDVARSTLTGLREAIEAGPHGAVPPILAARRLAAAAAHLAGACD
jgi:hypothetical protein